MRKRRVILLLVSALLFLIAASPFLISMREVDWWLIGSSGEVLKAGNMELYSVVGQGFAGDMNVNSIKVCSGFLCLWDQLAQFCNYLPLLFK